MACDESANQEFQGDDEFDIIETTSAVSFLFPRHRTYRNALAHHDRFPAASMSTICRQDLRPEFAARNLHFPLQTRPSQENDMPNRGELPNPRRAKDAVAPGPSDAWPIICFCAVGALMSIYMAVSYLGINAIPGLMSQFPGG